MKALKIFTAVLGFFVLVEYIATPLVNWALWLTGAASYNVHKKFERGWNWAKVNFKD
jgi:uncharacterized membrane protein YozB (DUF420 family)